MKRIKFKDFITLQRGFDLPRKEMIRGEVPVVGSTSIIGYHNEFKVLPPGVVTGRSGSLGKVQYVKTKFWPHNTSLWIKDFKGNYPRYVYYKLKTINFDNFNAGVGVPTLNRNHLDNYELEIHEYPAQEKVSVILSNYDDLLELNTLRIELLEKTAKLIYDEWFVKFKFPGHEKVKMVDSALGEVPEGWSVRQLQDIANINKSNLGNREEFSEIKYIDISAVSKGEISAIETLPLDTAPGRARRKVRHGDIIWSTVRPNLGAYALILDPPPDLIVSTGFAVISPKTISYCFLYQALTTEEFVGYLVNHTRGSAYPAVNTEDFENAKILLPPPQILQAYDNFAVNLYSLIHTLQEKNSSLRSTRDLLLPKLISGEIDVSNLDIKYLEMRE